MKLGDKMVKPIISGNIRVRLKDHFHVGEGSIIDDYSYFSARISIGRFCHVANNVSIAGGKEVEFLLGDYSSVSAGTRIWCASDNFVADMAALVPADVEITKQMIVGDVKVGQLTIIGSNCVVMPKNTIPEGVAIGAMSFVPSQFEFEPWMVYAGIPIKPIRARDKESVLKQKAQLIEQCHSDSIEN